MTLNHLIKLYSIFVTAAICMLCISVCYSEQKEDNDFTFKASGKRYEPNWKSLDSRPLPKWYDEAKIGIFLHWGVYSVPSFDGAWFWYWWKGPRRRLDIVEFMEKNYRPGFTYADFAPEFTAEFYRPTQWAEIFNASGAKYVVLTSKHHEGFCNWPSKVSWNWNSMDVGPKRDLVGELAQAVRQNTDIKFGLYHSLLEFFNPLLEQDAKNGFHTQEFVKRKTMPELYELVNAYKPDVLWSDGDWVASDTYWNSTNFLAWLYNDSPVKDQVVTNDRWGNTTICKHGGYLTCTDSYNPRKLVHRKFEDATTMAKNGWSFLRTTTLNLVHTMDEITDVIAQVVSCGGNVLINVGPTKDGIIVPIFEERLRQMGSWLAVNGEAIYASRPWSFQNDSVNSDVWYTKKEEDGNQIVYAILLKWPTSDSVYLADPKPSSLRTVVTLLGYAKPFEWSYGMFQEGMQIQIPTLGINDMPCQWAWVLKLTHIQN